MARKSRHVGNKGASQPPKPPEIDSETFESAMEGVKKIKKQRHHEDLPAPKVKVREHTTAAQEVDEAPHLPQLQVGSRANVDRRTAEKLAKGQMVIEAILDLHGSTVKEAHGKLTRFIESAVSHGLRCIIVVTGKGKRTSEGEVKGVLRESVPMWLNEPALRKHIIMVTHASPHDGGEGALYVLLKRRRK